MRPIQKVLREIKEFAPEKYTAAKRARLERLLDQIDEAAKTRKIYLDQGRQAALHEWLNNPEVRDTAHEYAEVSQSISKDRFKPYLKELLESAFGTKSPEIEEKLESFFLSGQQKAVAYMESSFAKFLDGDIDRMHWERLNKLYKELLSEFPEILNNHDDIEGAIKFGRIMVRERMSLTMTWNRAIMSEQMHKAKYMLKEAYPKDNVDHLNFAAIETKDLVAGFHSSIDVDTMTCGPLLSGDGKNKKFWDFGLFIVAHEYQHRRQLLLTDKLKKGELKQGSAEYYQARLYHAENQGGYLTPMTAKSRLTMTAQMNDYFEQPIEKQANNIAKISSIAGGTGGAAMWAFNEKLNKAFSHAARPLDKLVFNTKKISKALFSSKKPSGPSL